MRAITHASHGGPEVTSLSNVPDPVASPGQVLVRVAGVGLNPVDAHQRTGAFKLIQPFDFPQVAGNELSGVVAAVGAGVDAFAVGDRVMARTPGVGAFAELVAVPAAVLAPAPATIPLVDAAAIPLAGLTAQQALGGDHLDLQPGERLLITGGAGGVGLFAIQLAKLAGAHVTTTASSAGREVVTRLGADEVIDYHERAVSAGPERFDKVLDLVGGDTLTDLFASVEPGAKVVNLSGPFSPGSLQPYVKGAKKLLVAGVEWASSRKVRALAKKAGASYEAFLMHADGEGLSELSSLVEQGKLEVVVDSRHALGDFPVAFERLESHRAKGKVLIAFDPSLG
ncbi:NADP-dependent oxidoreductase [Luteococcus sanguinis]|uniref:NADP-dependent oxidoreductase n=1 Tax=Luteococcus sanguinis TaxID=174038 RepID=A0ABW1X182_9ACTN